MPDLLEALANSPLAGGIAGGLIFGGYVKAEIRNLHEKVIQAIATATRAHVRLDDHIDRHHVNGGKNA